MITAGIAGKSNYDPNLERSICFFLANIVVVVRCVHRVEDMSMSIVWIGGVLFDVN